MDMDYQETETREPSEQIAGRFVGMAVFLAGIALLVMTFVITYQAFHNPDMIVPLRETLRTPAPASSSVFVPAIVKFVLLIAMVYISSLIAFRGAQMFLYARKEGRRVTHRD